PVSNKIYVANQGLAGATEGSITVIDGETNTTTNLIDHNAGTPNEVAVNPITNKIYVANGTTDNITVIHGRKDALIGTIADPKASGAARVAVNSVTNRIYVSNTLSENMTVIDGSNDTVLTTIPVGHGPSAIAVNPVTNKIYVANSGNCCFVGGSITVI